MPAPAIDLITVADLLIYANVLNPTSPVNAVAQEIVTGWSTAVYWMTGRTPQMLKALTAFTESYNGSGSDVLYLRNAPVVSVASLQINGLTIPASTGYGSSGFFVQGDGKSIALRFTSASSFLPSNFGFIGKFIRGRGNVAISYTAGYDGVPADLLLLTLKQCTILLNKRLREDEASHVIPNSGQTDYHKWVLQPEVVRFLQPYIRTAMVNIFGAA